MVIIDRRKFERQPTELEAKYSVKGLFKWEEEKKCIIEDVSEDGMGLKTEDILKQGTHIKIIFPEQTITAKIIYVDGHDIGVKYEKLTPEQLDFVKKIIAEAKQ